MKKNTRLLWQLYPSYLLITIVSLVAVSWYASHSLRNFFLERTLGDLKARAYIIENVVAKNLIEGKIEAIDDICKSSGEMSGTRITVVMPTGKVIGDSETDPAQMENHRDRPEILKAFQGGIGYSRRFSDTLGESLMYAAIPIQDNGRPAAVLRVSLPVTFIDQELKLIQQKIIFVGVFTILFASGISLLISRRITKPIEEIKKGAEAFAKGDFSRKLYVGKTEEIAGLSSAMNKMAEQLDDRIKKVVSQRNELEAVLASMVEGVIALDQEEKIININHAAENIFGIDSKQIKGSTVQEMIRSVVVEKFVKRALLTDESIEEDLVLKQLERRTLHVRSTPLLDEGKERIGTLFVVNDVTKIRRLENMRRDFAANVSHEIRTPLTAIKGFVETLLHSPKADKDETVRFLGIIDKNVDRLIAIIEDLLKLSRIEQEEEKREILLERGNVTEALYSAFEICRAKIDEKNIRVDIDADKSLDAMIDRPLIEQAMMNLIDNAAKYSDEQSEIHIKAYREGNGVCVSFRDYGIGIPPKHLPRLFERFYRVDKARSRKLGGTGLGLAIVKHILSAHGGTVTVESTPGKGSTFTIRIPA